MNCIHHLKYKVKWENHESAQVGVTALVVPVVGVGSRKVAGRSFSSVTALGVVPGGRWVGVVALVVGLFAGPSVLHAVANNSDEDDN